MITIELRPSKIFLQRSRRIPYTKQPARRPAGTGAAGGFYIHVTCIGANCVRPIINQYKRTNCVTLKYTLRSKIRRRRGLGEYRVFLR